MSSFFRLNSADFIKGLVVAVLGAVLASAQQMLTGHGLEFAAWDWSLIFDVAVTAGGSYLSKNLFTTADGRFLGAVKL